MHAKVRLPLIRHPVLVAATWLTFQKHVRNSTSIGSDEIPRSFKGVNLGGSLTPTTPPPTWLRVVKIFFLPTIQIPIINFYRQIFKNKTPPFEMHSVPSKYHDQVLLRWAKYPPRFILNLNLRPWLNQNKLQMSMSTKM
jgi:hypothetical protein